MTRHYQAVPLTVFGLLLPLLIISTDIAASAGTLTRVSGPSPFAGCNIQPSVPGETNYLNAEVEPWVAVNPRNSHNIVGVWQQDRWQFGGSRGVLTGISHDGGLSWKRTFAHFSRCAGGSAANGGDYERAGDPWVSFSPNGTVYQSVIAASVSTVSDFKMAVLVSHSINGGNTWSEPTTLIRDTDASIFNDKQSITADPRNTKFAYAVWDRFVFTDATQNELVRAPTTFARTTNGGAGWEPARTIYDPGPDTQTLANQIVVLRDGTLVNLFVRFLHANEGSPNPGDVTLGIIRSKDMGVTWSPPVIINTLESIGVVDAKTGEPVRTGDVIPNIAADQESGDVYVVWQDARFSGHLRDGVVFSKSTDGGLTWSAPVQVNRAPNVQAFTASVDVAEDGAIAVTHYDFRRDTPDPKTLLTDYWRLTSHNKGKTWTESHVAGSFDMRTAPFAGGFFLGDYQGLSHGGEALVSLFVQTNSGNTENRTDVFAAATEENGGTESNRHDESNSHPQSWRERLASHRESPRR